MREVELTKWPRLLVIGEPVEPEQANEILLRTDDWWLMSNDKAWQETVRAAAGITGADDWQASRDFQLRIDALELNFLHNSRIMSSWIGGPKGWCDWDGNIGCSTWNIGKWPSVEEVHKDWTAIAAAFPYLHLRAQLVPNEGGAPHPAVEWLVRRGEAHLVESIGKMIEPEEVDVGTFLRRFTLTGERGVTLERLQEALAQLGVRPPAT